MTRARAMGRARFRLEGDTAGDQRQNLTMGMQMRRFTRLTNVFSKKVENHEHAIALCYVHYNFCRIHKSLRVPPAIEAGIANDLWTLDELMELSSRRYNLPRGGGTV